MQKLNKKTFIIFLGICFKHDAKSIIDKAVRDSSRANVSCPRVSLPQSDSRIDKRTYHAFAFWKRIRGGRMVAIHRTVAE